MSHALRYILPLLAAVALTVGLIVHSGITFSEFRHAISGFSVASVLGVLACTAVFLLLSSVKWRMVMRRVGAESRHLEGWAPYVYYTSLGAALSIFMTVHVSVAVTRALGAKLHLKQSPIVGAGASVYEQMFDLGVLVLFVLSTLFALLFGLDPLGWAIASASAVVLAGAGGWMLVGRSRRVLLGSSRLLSRYFHRFKPAADRQLRHPEMSIALTAPPSGRYAVFADTLRAPATMRPC